MSGVAKVRVSTSGVPWRLTLVVVAAVALVAALWPRAVPADGDESPLPEMAFVVTAFEFPDALAAGSVAGVLGAPIVLTPTDSLDSGAQQALDDADPELVVLVGGTAVLSEGLEAEIEGQGYDVERVAGAVRTHTAAELVGFVNDLAPGRPVVTEREVEAGTIPGLDAETLQGLGPDDLDGDGGPQGPAGEPGPTIDRRAPSANVDADLSPAHGRDAQVTVSPEGNPVILSRGASQVEPVQLVLCQDPDCAEAERIIPDADDLSFSPGSVAIGADGNPVVAFRNDGDAAVAHCDDPACEEVTINAVLEDAGAFDGNPIRIGADGNPIVATRQLADGDEPGIHVVECGDPACDSADSTRVSTDVSVDSIDMVVRGDGRPIVFYIDGGDEVQAVDCADPACQDHDREAIGSALDASAAMGSDGHPVLAVTTIPGEPHVWHCTSMDCSDISDGVLSFGSGAGADIAVGKQGHPVVTYRTGDNELRVATCDSYDCDRHVTNAVGTDVDEWPTTVTLRADGTPFVAYAEGDSLRGLGCGSEFCASYVRQR